MPNFFPLILFLFSYLFQPNVILLLLSISTLSIVSPTHSVWEVKNRNKCSFINLDETEKTAIFIYVVFYEKIILENNQHYKLSFLVGVRKFRDLFPLFRSPLSVHEREHFSRERGQVLLFKELLLLVASFCSTLQPGRTQMSMKEYFDNTQKGEKGEVSCVLWGTQQQAPKPVWDCLEACSYHTVTVFLSGIRLFLVFFFDTSFFFRLLWKCDFGCLCLVEILMGEKTHRR